MPLHHNIAVLRYVDPCLGLPRRTRRPPPAACSVSVRTADMPKYISAYFSRRPKFISVAAWGARLRECSTPSIGFNLCLGLPRRTRRPFPAACSASVRTADMPKYISAYFLRRPTFISVTVSGARFWERSTLSNWFNLARRPKFISVTVSGARFRECSISSIGFNLCENCSTFRRISLVDHKRATWTPGVLLYPLFCENDAMPKYISAYFLRRPKFISVTVSGARFWERSTLSNWFNLCENCCIDQVRLPWVASRRRSVAGILAFCQLRRSMRYY